MNILSNILKIDYSLYIINDIIIIQDITTKLLNFIIFEHKNIKSIIKYDNIYYLEYFSEQTGITFILISNDTIIYKTLISYKNNSLISFNLHLVNIDYNYIKKNSYKKEKTIQIFNNTKLNKKYIYYTNNNYEHSYYFSNFYYKKKYNTKHKLYNYTYFLFNINNYINNYNYNYNIYLFIKINTYYYNNYKTYIIFNKNIYHNYYYIKNNIKLFNIYNFG